MTRKPRNPVGILIYRTWERVIKELKQPRRRPQRRFQKKQLGLMIKTIALHSHHAFKYISLTFTARLRRENS